MQNALHAVEDKDDALITVQTLHQGNNVLLTVSDNGCGMNTEEKSQIFEPFRTGKVNGTGLGLSIVTKILADHQAAIEFTSASSGTEFTLRFPRQARRAGASQQNKGSRSIESGDHGWRSS